MAASKENLRMEKENEKVNIKEYTSKAVTNIGERKPLGNISNKKTKNFVEISSTEKAFKIPTEFVESRVHCSGVDERNQINNVGVNQLFLSSPIHDVLTTPEIRNIQRL